MSEIKLTDEEQILGLLNRIGDTATINRINKAVIQRHRAIQREMAFEFSPGDRVSFKTRKGDRVMAQVVKRNQKTLRVDALDTEGNRVEWRSWNVSPGILQREADDVVGTFEQSPALVVEDPLGLVKKGER